MSIMAQKADDQIQAGINERESFIEQIEKLKQVVAVMEKVLVENCCIDDCGFDVYKEPRMILECAMINNDKVAREALAKVREFMND